MPTTPDPPPEAGPSKQTPGPKLPRTASDDELESEPSDADWSDEEFEVGESYKEEVPVQLLTALDAIKWAKWMDSRRTRQDGWRGWHYGVMVCSRDE